MTRKVKQWIAFGLALMLAIAISFYWFVHHINHEFAERHRAHVQLAMQQTTLTNVNDVLSSVAERRYTIVRGVDAAGEPLIVWVAKDDVREAYEDSGVSERWVRNQHRNMVPGADMIRVQPAMYADQPVWEVYYVNRVSEGREQYGYDYFSFFDGSKIGSITLAKEE